MTTRKSTASSKSMFSIRTKFALLSICSILIAVIIVTTMLLNVCKQAITNSTEVTMQDLSTSYSNNLNQALRQISESANFMMSSAAISSYVEAEGTEGDSEVEDLITMYLSTNSSCEDISITDAEGIILYSTNSSNIGKDLSKESYFTEMVDTGLSAQGDVFTSESSGEALITFAIPLRTDLQVIGFEAPSSDSANTSVPDQTSTQETTPVGGTVAPQGMMGQQTPVEEFTGSIIASVKVSEFTSDLSDIKIADYDTGYAFILDSSGNYVYHPNESLIGTAADMAELQAIATSSATTDTATAKTLEFTENGVRKYTSYSVISDNQWTLFIAADQSEVFSVLGSVVKESILVSIAIALVMAAIAYLFTGQITKSIRSITRLIHKTAALDFTQDSSFVALSARRDETGEMSRAIEKMRSALNEMVSHISSISGRINESSESLNQISCSVNDHASDNSATAEELSAGMEETAATTEQIHAAIEQIDNSSREILNQVTKGTQLSNELSIRALSLKESTDASTTAARKIYQEVKNRTDSALEQSKAVQKITILANAIKEIAGQTNLLALNASIEAARAGEAGAGFAVVASEIGNLAQQSSSTVQGISEIVEEVYSAVDNMAKSLKLTLEFLEKNVLVNYSEFSEHSNYYNEEASGMNDTMETIQKQIEYLNTSLTGISISIAEINRMVNEASQGVSDVAEKNTDIVTLTSSTQHMAEENTEHAKSLTQIVDKFTL